jgi:hypothetical protein
LESKYGALLVGLVILLILAIVRLRDFGASIDEWHNMHYGQLFLQAYGQENLFRPVGINYFNGPFYFMLFTVTSRLFHALVPAWLFTDGLHLTNFITFLIGVFFFFRLALRFFPRGASLFLMALFVSQPVLFMRSSIRKTRLDGVLLAAVELGWTGVTGGCAFCLAGRRPEAGRSLALSHGSSWRLVGGGHAHHGVCRRSPAGRPWWGGVIQRAARTLLGQLYAGRGPAFLVALFQRVAVDAYKTALEAYSAKLDGFLAWSRNILSPLLIAALMALWRVAFPTSFEKIAGRWFRRWALVPVALWMAISI